MALSLSSSSSLATLHLLNGRDLPAVPHICLSPSRGNALRLSLEYPFIWDGLDNGNLLLGKLVLITPTHAHRVAI